MTDMNITTLKDANSEPEQDVIDKLEAALSLAREGKLRDVAIISTATGWEMYSSFSASDIPMLVGALSYQIHVMNQTMWEGE